MRLITHDDIETWLERRVSAREYVPDPPTLNEVGTVQVPVVVAPGDWERVDERHPKMGVGGNVETMFGGFELETQDLEKYDYRLALKRGMKEEWTGDLRLVVCVDDNTQTLYVRGEAGEIVSHPIHSNGHDLLPNDPIGKGHVLPLGGEGIQATGTTLIADPATLAPPGLEGLAPSDQPTVAEFDEDEDTLRLIFGLELEATEPVSEVIDVISDPLLGGPPSIHSTPMTNAGRVQRVKQVLGHVPRLSPIPEITILESSSTPSGPAADQEPVGMSVELSTSTTEEMAVATQTLGQTVLVSEVVESVISVEQAVPVAIDGTRKGGEKTTSSACIGESEQSGVVDTAALEDEGVVEAALRAIDEVAVPFLGSTTSKGSGNMDTATGDRSAPSSAMVSALITVQEPTARRRDDGTIGEEPFNEEDINQQILDAVLNLVGNQTGTTQDQGFDHSTLPHTNINPLEVPQVPLQTFEDFMAQYPPPVIPAPPPALRLLNSAETKLGSIRIDMYRGTYVEPSASGGRSSAQFDFGLLDFDPERSTRGSSGDELDPVNTPWCRLIYEYGPSEVWTEEHQTITDEHRQRAQKEEEVRLAIETLEMQYEARMQQERLDRTRRLEEELKLAKIEAEAQKALKEEREKAEDEQNQRSRMDEKNRKARVKRAQKREEKGDPPLRPQKPAATTTVAGPSKPKSKSKAEQKVKAQTIQSKAKVVDDEILVPESPPQLRLPLSQLEYRFRTRQPAPLPSHHALPSVLETDRSRAKSPWKVRARSPVLDPIIDDPPPRPKAGPSRQHPREERGRERARERDRQRDYEESHRRRATRSRSPTRHRSKTSNTRYPESHAHGHRERHQSGETTHRERERDRDQEREAKPKIKSPAPLHPLTEAYKAKRARSDGPSAYGLHPRVNSPLRAESRSRSKILSDLEDEPSAIEQLSRAQRLQKELRAEMQKKLEEKEARRAEKRRHQPNTPDAGHRGGGGGGGGGGGASRRGEEGAGRGREKTAGRAREEVRREVEVPRRRVRTHRIERHARSSQYERDKMERRKKRAADAAQARLDRQKVVVRQMAEDDARELIDLTLLDD